jgi:hypothetical protein
VPPPAGADEEEAEAEELNGAAPTLDGAPQATAAAEPEPEAEGGEGDDDASDAVAEEPPSAAGEPRGAAQRGERGDQAQAAAAAAARALLTPIQWAELLERVRDGLPLRTEAERVALASPPLDSRQRVRAVLGRWLPPLVALVSRQRARAEQLAALGRAVPAGLRGEAVGLGELIERLAAEEHAAAVSVPGGLAAPSSSSAFRDTAQARFGVTEAEAAAVGRGAMISFPRGATLVEVDTGGEEARYGWWTATYRGAESAPRGGGGVRGLVPARRLKLKRAARRGEAEPGGEAEEAEEHSLQGRYRALQQELDALEAARRPAGASGHRQQPPAGQGGSAGQRALAPRWLTQVSQDG